MTRASSYFVLFLLAGALACASSPEPEPPPTYGVGSLMPPAMLEDQFGERHPVDQDVNMILFASDMEGGELIQEVLSRAEPGLLEEHEAVYIADISRMPKLVTRTMAMPALKKRGYPTLLDRTGTVTASFPGEPGKATVIRLEKLRIWEIESFSDVEALRLAIER